MSKRYLKIQEVTKGPKGTSRSKRYLRVQKVPKGPRNPNGTLRSKVSKGYLTVQGIQRAPKGPRYPKGT